MILQVSRISKAFGGIKAIHDLSFSVNHREILGLIGPNGAGKTVTLNIVSGVYKPGSGSVTFKGEDITGWRSSRIVEHGLARTFQSAMVFNDHSVLDNLVIANHCRLKTGFWHALFWKRAVQKEKLSSESKALELLDFVGLREQASVRASELPYGSQKALGLANTLATDPSLIFLDEPTNGMNAEETDKMINLIKRTSTWGVTIIIIEHNMRVVMGLCERIVVISSGEKIAEGKPEEIRRNEAVIKAYLGEEQFVDSFNIG